MRQIECFLGKSVGQNVGFSLSFGTEYSGGGESDNASLAQIFFKSGRKKVDFRKGRLDLSRNAIATLVTYRPTDPTFSPPPR